MGIPAIRQYEKYLGLPALVGWAKKRSFIYIKERVWKKLQGWKEKLLSVAGREVLIKAVIQAIPTYIMSCFKLPKGKELEVLIRKFWWGYTDDSRKVHWVSWERLCEAKEMGGMGFKEIEKFNDALLAKQVWRLMHNLDLLCFRVFKARFFPNCSILDAKESNFGSYAWKSILSARDVIKKGMVWRIGNGQAVRIKENKWLLVRPSRVILSPFPSVMAETKVSSLINQESSVWKSKEVNRVFLPHEASLILSIPLSRRQPPDCASWSCTPSGNFSTSSAYKLLAAAASLDRASTSNQADQSGLWKRLWKLQVPNKIKHFVWRVCNNALPTKCNLKRRHIANSNICELCNDASEDALHAFCFCSHVAPMWLTHHWFQSIISPPPLSFRDLLNKFIQVDDEFRPELFAIIS